MTILSASEQHSSGGLAGLRRETINGFTVLGWMPDTARDILTQLIDQFEVSTVIEVGSYVGMSACWFAERVDTVACVDHFNRHLPGVVLQASDYPDDDQYGLFLRNTAAYPNITSIRSDSLEAARLPIKADLVYIDADHTYDGVKADVEAWRSHAVKVVCGDDNTPAWPSIQQYAKEIGANTEGRVWWFAV